MTLTGTQVFNLKSDAVVKIMHSAWNDSGPQHPVHYIVRFPTPFGAPPVIMLAISGMEVMSQQRFHFSLQSIDVTPESFKIQLVPTGLLDINSVTVSWLATDA